MTDHSSGNSVGAEEGIRSLALAGGGRNNSFSSQAGVLARLREIRRNRWAELNDIGRYLVLRSIRALEKDTGEVVK